MEISEDDDLFKKQKVEHLRTIHEASFHPLVILNISEHWTRLRAQSSADTPIKFFGAILGKQTGKSIEMINSFELKWSLNGDNAPEIDLEFFRIREKQSLEVFPNLEVIGWYTSGLSESSDNDTIIHRQFTEVHNSLVMVKFNPCVDSNQLPFTLFEATPDDSAELMNRWELVNYTIASEEAERVGVEHVAVSHPATESNFGGLLGQVGATDMLMSRLKLIDDYLTKVKSGAVVGDETILRWIVQLTQKLQVVKNSELDAEISLEAFNSKLIACMCVLPLAIFNISTLSTDTMKGLTITPMWKMF